MRFKKVSYKEYKNAIKGDINLTEEYDDIKLPTRATNGSAGYDFCLPFDISLASSETMLIPTGIRWECDYIAGFVLSIYPKSGLAFKYGLRLVNTVGKIDEDYCNSDNEGHIMIKIINNGNETINLKKGKSFVQGIIETYYAVDDEDIIVNIRNGGFDSTSE